MRFLNDKFLVGLTAVIFNERNEVLLVRHTYRKIEWSLPGGYLLAKEHPIEGLEREIEEETGFIVSIDFPLKVRTDREIGRLDLSYVGYFCGGEFKKSDEVYDYGFFEIEKLPLLIRSQTAMIHEAMIQKQEFDNKKNDTTNRRKFFQIFRNGIKKKPFITQILLLHA